MSLYTTNHSFEALQRECKEVRVAIESTDRGYIIRGLRDGKQLLVSEHRHWTLARKYFVAAYSRLVLAKVFEQKGA